MRVAVQYGGGDSIDRIADRRLGGYVGTKSSSGSSLQLHRQTHFRKVDQEINREAPLQKPAHHVRVEKIPVCLAEYFDA